MSTSVGLKSITFFYPSRIIGGAEFLYIRLARYIASTTPVKVYVFDFEDGFLRKNLEGTNVHLLNYSEKEKVVIDYETTLVTPFNHIFNCTEFTIKHPDVKVLFWSIHPTHFTSFFSNRNWFLTPFKRERIASIFDYLMENRSLVYMDSPNFDENQHGIKFKTLETDLTHLPICCDTYDGELHRFSLANQINICWLGRIAHDKIQAIENFVGHLSRLPEPIKAKIKFIVIGNGDEDKRLDAFLLNSGINYERKHTITGELLNNYLKDNIDVGVAMGTSLLEFAKLGIPVITTDIMSDYEQEIDNKFQWLYETKGFSMGRLYSRNSDYKHTVSEMMEQLMHSDSYNRIAKDCYTYYQTNHSLPAITSSLLNMAIKAQVNVGDSNLKELTTIMNPWYFKLLRQIKNVLN